MASLITAAAAAPPPPPTTTTTRRWPPAGKDTDLGREDHVDALVLNELGVLGQEGQDVGHLGAGRQVAHAYTVPASAVGDEVLGHGDGDGGGGQLGDEGGGQLALRLLGVPRVHAAVQNLQTDTTRTHSHVHNSRAKESW